MKVKLGTLRKMIHEEYMRGVPEFMLRDATHKYVEVIRQHVQRHIAATKKSPIAAREAIELANKTLLELEEEANQLLENKLWEFIRST